MIIRNTQQLVILLTTMAIKHSENTVAASDINMGDVGVLHATAPTLHSHCTVTDLNQSHIKFEFRITSRGGSVEQRFVLLHWRLLQSLCPSTY